MLSDEQCVVNQYVTEVEIPGLGKRKTVGNLVSLSETPGSVKGDPPVLGEANSEVLGRLGLSPDECASIEQHASTVRADLIAQIMVASGKTNQDES